MSVLYSIHVIMRRAIKRLLCVCIECMIRKTAKLFCLKFCLICIILGKDMCMWPIAPKLLLLMQALQWTHQGLTSGERVSVVTIFVELLPSQRY